MNRFKSMPPVIRTGLISAIIIIMIAGFGLVAQGSLGNGPVVDKMIPAPGANVSVLNPAIGFSLSDPDRINQSSLQVSLNGKAVSANLTFASTGHWENGFDSCSGEPYTYWVIDSYDYTKANVTVATSKLPDQNTVKVMVKDQLGNSNTAEWNFTAMFAPDITGLSPANGSVVNVKPNISAKITDNGIIDSNSIVMKIASQTVSPSFDQITGVVSYTPANPLSEGPCNIYLEVKDTAGNIKTASWTVTVVNDINGPVFSGFKPTPDSTLATNSAVISFIAEDAGQINGSSVMLKVNGTNVPYTISYPEIGHFGEITDSCSGDTYTTWIVDGYDYKKATITANVSKLPDINTVWISASDKPGNVSTHQWTFKTPLPPVITNLSPAAGSILKTIPKISAQVTDNGTIDTGSIILKIGNVVVPHSFDVKTGIVSYVPTSPLPNGAQNIYIEVKDTAGNVKTATWTFTTSTDTNGPVLSDNKPAPGTSITTTNTVISFTASDPEGINSSSIQLNVNGKTIPVMVKYPELGHYELQEDTCSGQMINVWVSDGYDYTRAAVTSSQINSLPDENSVTVSVADKAGNVTLTSWTFKTTVSPVITNLKPVNGTNSITRTPAISAQISDNGLIDQDSIVLKLGENIVNHIFTATGYSTGTVTYTPIEPLPDGAYKISLEVRDQAGNASSASWGFSVGQGTAGFTVLSPLPDATVNVLNPAIQVVIQDFVALKKETIQMKVNNTSVTPTVTFKEIGHWGQMEDSCTGELIDVWIRDGWDYSYATVTYRPAFSPDSTNKVDLSVININGGPSTYSWNFQVKIPPRIFDPYPANNSFVAIKTPPISAKVTDNSGIARVIMKVNGNDVTPLYNPLDNTVTYVPTEPLANDTTHTVNLTAVDNVGATATLNWSFGIQTYPDMNFTGPCNRCHIGYPAPYHPMTNCFGCHGGNRPVEDCADCHGTYVHSPEVLNGAYGHGAYWEPRCDWCHSPEFSDKIPSHPADNDTYHNTTTNMEKCNSCHVMSLTREHYRHTDSDGDKLNCQTCHTSSDRKVQIAIANKQKNCDACHPQADHDALHSATGISTNCTSCHRDNLIQEHFNNSVTQVTYNADTGKTAWTCNTCHSSDARKTVKDAVYNDKKLCSDCHLPKDILPEDDMPNTLSSAGCITCHKGYPGNVSTGKMVHTTTKCNVCHVAGISVGSMWNCQYCHITQYTDSYPVWTGSGYQNWTGTVSGFKSWRDPLRGLPLGTKTRWMGSHYTGGSSQYLPPNSWPVDANFDFHTTGPHIKHESVLPQADCARCHKDSLTAEHYGRSKLFTNPAEDFEDGDFSLNFTGQWGGDWLRSDQTAYAGKYSFMSGLIPNAATEASVNVNVSGTVSFMYKVVNPQWTKLYFYIDGKKVFEGSATNWTSVSFPLTAGTRNLKWSANYNKVYIDELVITGATAKYNIDCNTCHLSSDLNVQNSIANHKTNCASCHGEPDHSAVHEITILDSNCTTCHINNLTQEHLNNPVTQTDPITGQPKPWNCATCHESSIPVVNEALAVDNTNCAACHKSGHNLIFAESIASDISLWDKFKWTAPMDVDLWQGEEWVKQEFLNGGKTVVSNRTQTIAPADIWAYYLDEMSENGWTISGILPVTGSVSSYAEFTKGNHKAVIWVYGGNKHNDQILSTGYRIEIIYR